MKSLYLRIWLTVVAALALFALVSGWMWHRHLDEERIRFEAQAAERVQAIAELVRRSLPAADAPAAEQAQALRDWSLRLRVPMALDDALGERVAASESFLRRQAEGNLSASSVRLDDGRTLWFARRTPRRMNAGPPEWRDDRGGDHADDRHDASGLWPRPPRGGASLPMGRWMGAPDGGPPMDGPRGGGAMMDGPRGGGPMMDGPRGGPVEGPGRGPAGPGLRGVLLGDAPAGLGPTMPPLPLGLPRAVGPLVLVAMLFVAVAAGAYPVVRRLTRRLEALQQGVEAFGRGNLAQRVDDSGRDEVARVAATFNATAARIETLVRSHQSLLANASHELRSPLARLKMAVAMFGDLPDAQRAELRQEIDTNIAELDALVEEVLLASRLDSSQALDLDERVDLLGIAAEEAARSGADLVDGEPIPELRGSERLLRRALRNLLENARRYGGAEVQVALTRTPGGGVAAEVRDRGPGVPEALRERIFEPFYRVPGHAEGDGGVGLGLSLVRQIAQRHGGSVRCLPRDGGGSCFALELPVRG